eukprot:g3770.t1
MKQSSIFQLALFYLVLLLSHESITVANTIRQTVGLRHDAKISNTLNNIVKYMEHVDVDSFLEVENMHGMSAEAYGTLEMREMHKSLIEGFSFEHSPILDDLKNLNEIPENKILSPSELSQHREDVSVLLEKAMSGWGWGGSKATAKVVTKKDKALLLGECERTTTLTCGKHSDCRPDKENPCKGECICDDDGANECECVAKGTMATAKVNADKALSHTKEIDKALSVKGAVGAALFGFVDGFFSGTASALRTKFEDPKCNSSDVKDKLQNVVRKFKHMWTHIKKVHKKVWKSEGRKHIIDSVKAFVTSLIDLLKEGIKYMLECPGTKMLVVTVGMIAAMLIMNIAFLALGLVVIPLIIKYAGMIMGLYFSFKYMTNKVLSLYRGTKKMIAKECHGTCQKKMIEDSFGMIGAITEVIVMSGLNKVLKIKADKTKPFFKRFGMEYHSDYIKDMKYLGHAAKRAKRCMCEVINRLRNMFITKKIRLKAKRAVKKLEVGDMFNDDLKTVSDKGIEIQQMWTTNKILSSFSNMADEVSELLFMCNDKGEKLKHCKEFNDIKKECKSSKLKKWALKVIKKAGKKSSKRISECTDRMKSLYYKAMESPEVMKRFEQRVASIKILRKEDEKQLNSSNSCGKKYRDLRLGRGMAQMQKIYTRPVHICFQK